MVTGVMNTLKKKRNEIHNSVSVFAVDFGVQTQDHTRKDNMSLQDAVVVG